MFNEKERKIIESEQIQSQLKLNKNISIKLMAIC